MSTYRSTKKLKSEIDLTNESPSEVKKNTKKKLTKVTRLEVEEKPLLTKSNRAALCVELLSSSSSDDEKRTITAFLPSTTTRPSRDKSSNTLIAKSYKKNYHKPDLPSKNKLGSQSLAAKDKKNNIYDFDEDEDPIMEDTPKKHSKRPVTPTSSLEDEHSPSKLTTASKGSFTTNIRNTTFLLPRAANGAQQKTQNPKPSNVRKGSDAPQSSKTTANTINTTNNTKSSPSLLASLSSNSPSSKSSSSSSKSNSSSSKSNSSSSKSNSSSSISNSSSSKSINNQDARKNAKKPSNKLSFVQNHENHNRTGDSTIPWVDLYAPKTVAESAIQPKKAQEVREWLLSAVGSRGRLHKLLVLQGVTGIGKTVLVHLLAKELGFELVEWLDTIHFENRDADDRRVLEYSSRLKELREFLQGAKRYSDLTSTNVGAVSPRLIVIEDLPYLHGIEQRQEFENMMREYVLTSQFPLVLILNTDTFHPAQFLPPDLLASTAVTSIQMRPVADGTMKKTLKAILHDQGILGVPAKDVDDIASNSHGDIRLAINSLQFHCLIPKPLHNDLESGAAPLHSLSIFHTLGKLCHKKDRPHSPEEVISRSGLQPRMVTLFLLENHVSFFSDIHDLAEISEDFSWTDLVGSTTPETVSENYYESVVPRAMSVRNNTPATPKFHPFTKPKALSVSRAAQENRALLQRSWTAQFSEHHAKRREISFVGAGALLAEVVPTVASMGRSAPVASEFSAACQRVARFGNSNINSGSTGGVLMDVRKVDVEEFVEDPLDPIED